jgi:signal peptidase II
MLRRGLAIAAAIAAADQISKWIILLWVMNPPRVIEVTGFFNLVLVFNRGVSFGMFQNDSHWGPILLGALTVAIIVFLFFWLRSAETRMTALAVGMVMGGAVGNLIDRGFHHAVVDFLDFHAFGRHWPAFNVADSAISIGVALIILETLFERRRKPN